MKKDLVIKVKGRREFVGYVEVVVGELSCDKYKFFVFNEEKISMSDVKLYTKFKEMMKEHLDAKHK